MYAGSKVSTHAIETIGISCDAPSADVPGLPSIGNGGGVRHKGLWVFLQVAPSAWRLWYYERCWRSLCSSERGYTHTSPAPPQTPALGTTAHNALRTTKHGVLRLVADPGVMRVLVVREVLGSHWEGIAMANGCGGQSLRMTDPVAEGRGADASGSGGN